MLVCKKQDATGNDQPYLSAIPRAQMVNWLDAKKEDILQSVVSPESDGVGGGGRVWYDEEEDTSAYPFPTPNPLPTPNPQTTPNPEITPLPQPGPSPEMSDSFLSRLQRIRRNLSISLAERILLETILAASFGKGKYVGDSLAIGSDIITDMVGQEKWLEYVQAGEDDAATWDGSMITNQSLYSQTIGSFGAFGNYDDNGCGPIAIHNVNRLLGEDSNFADVAYELDSDSRNTAVAGGLLGMNPLTVWEYFGRKGYNVTLYKGTEGVAKNHDAYLAMYIYKNFDGSLGGHYVAMNRDPETDEYITYNEVYSTDSVPMKELDHLGRIDEEGNVDEENPRLLTVIWGIDKEG